MPTYQITAPNGQKLKVTGDHVPSESELQAIFSQAGVATGGTSSSGQSMSAAQPGTAKPPNFTQSDTSPNDLDPNTVGTALRHWWRGVNPFQLGQLLPFPKAAGGSGVDNPLNPNKIIADMLRVRDDAHARWDRGDKVGATAKYIEAATPILGPIMSQWGDEAEQGKWAALGGDVAGVVTAMKAPAIIEDVQSGAKSAVQKTKSAMSAGVDAVDPDLVSIFSPRGGAVLRKAQQLRDIMAKKGATPETPPVSEVPDVAVPATEVAESPIELTRRLKTEWLANRGITLEQAKAEAYQPVGSTQAPVAAPAPSSSTFTPSPLQKMFGMKPGVEPSPTQLSSSVRLAEIRAKVTLTAAEKTAVTDLVTQGTAPEVALSQVKGVDPAQAFSQKFGLPSVDEATQAVAERNRTGRWPKSPNSKQLAAKADRP